MEIDKLIKALTTNSRIFHLFNEEEMLAVLRCCVRKSYKGGEIVFKEGTKGNELYIIVTGSVIVKKESKTIDVIRSGECFGEMGALSDEERSATVEADGDILLLVIDLEKFDSLKCEIQIKFLKNVILVISERLRERIEDMVR